MALARTRMALARTPMALGRTMEAREGLKNQPRARGAAEKNFFDCAKHQLFYVLFSAPS